MKNWRSVLISPLISLKDAISVIDCNALRIAIVVDEQERLIGTLTDGDVRRALLQNLTLDTPVIQVMHSNPTVCHQDWSRSRALAVMERNGLLQLPIIDDTGTVVGLETLHGVLGANRLNNPIFLMAGGFGKRLYPLTDKCPKPLLKIGEKPILEIILERFIKSGFHRFFISTHYLSEMVEEYFGDGSRWGVSIRYTHEKTPLGTGGALGLLPRNEINEPMFMMNGDLLTTLDFRELLDFHQANPAVATMCVRQFEYQVPYGVIHSDGNLVKSIVEKPIQNFFVNAGIYLLSPDFVKSVKPNTKIDMPELLERSIAQGCNVTSFPIHEYWLDVGRIEDFDRAQTEIGGLLK